ncbi:MFS transporter, partial [archaeon]
LRDHKRAYQRPDSVYQNFPSMLRKLAGIYAVVALVGSLMVSEPKAAAVSTSSASNTKAPANAVAIAGLTLKQALSSPQFWRMWTMIICSATAGLNTASIYKQYAATSSALTGDAFQAFVGGIGALFNGFGRLFWGSVSDIIGFKNSFMVLTALQAAMMFSYTFTTTNKAAFAVNTWMLFFCLAGNLALMPPATYRMFGPQSGTVIYGVLYSAFAIASIFGGILTKSLVKTAGWARVFQVMTGMSVLACVLVSKLTPVTSYAESVV